MEISAKRQNYSYNPSTFSALFLWPTLQLISETSLTKVVKLIFRWYYEVPWYSWQKRLYNHRVKEVSFANGKMMKSSALKKLYLIFHVSYETLHSYMKMSYKQFVNCLKKFASAHVQTYYFETTICWPEFVGEMRINWFVSFRDSVNFKARQVNLPERS